MSGKVSEELSVVCIVSFVSRPASYYHGGGLRLQRLATVVGQGAGIKLRYYGVLGWFAERGGRRKKRNNGRVKRKLCSVTCAAGLFKACGSAIIKV